MKFVLKFICRLVGVFAMSSLLATAYASSFTTSFLGGYTGGYTTTNSYNLAPGGYELQGSGQQYYELNIGAQDLNVSFSLLNTNPDNQKVKYALYDDLLDSWKYVFVIDSNDPLAKTGGWITDALGNAVTPLDTLTALLDASHSYILAVSPQFSATQVWTSMNVSAANVSAVPLPGAVWLFGSALLGFITFSNRRKI